MTVRYIEIIGTSAPQGSKRHVGRGILIESSTRLKPWRERIISALQDEGWAGLQIPDPIVIRCHFLFPRPKSHYSARGLKPSAPSWPTSRQIGDIDKHQRALLDALTIAATISDDSQVITVMAQKRYCPEGVPPMLRLWLAPQPQIPRPPTSP